MRANASLRVGSGFLLVALVACNDSSTPTEPAFNPPDLKGTWTGQLSLGTRGVSESVPVVVGQTGSSMGTSTVNATWNSPTLGACTFSGSLSQSGLSGSVLVERPDSSFCGASQLRVEGEAAVSRVSIDSREICSLNFDLVPFHLVLSR